MTKAALYIVDFLNVFSDYREILYKQSHINFHDIKHYTRQKDTFDFFDNFFTKYLTVLGINVKSSQFMFVMKKLGNYEPILNQIMLKYNTINMKFLIIENNYNNIVQDKNKDDFLCQYIFQLYKNTHNCVLVSNDKYRDREDYVLLYRKPTIGELVIDENVEESTMTIKMLTPRSPMKKTQLTFEKFACARILEEQYKRCSIPKNKISLLLERSAPQKRNSCMKHERR